MAKTVKIRAKEKDGVATVKCLMKHPMETGRREDRKTGEIVPAHYITEVACELNGEKVMTAYLGPGVAKNPFMSFELNGAKKGDKVKIAWSDNKGESGVGEADIA